LKTAVLDASVFVAAVSPLETHHAEARRLYASIGADHPFTVPSLFRVEVLSALARRGESAEFLDTVDVLVSSPRFHRVEVDAAIIEEAVRVARQTCLRAYDAVYVALALRREAALLTLDAELRERAGAAFPELLWSVAAE